MILLPVWLLGCLLAEQSEALTADGRSVQIWAWRFLIWLGCWTTEMLHFKGGVPYTQTMVWFGVLAYWWVRKEIAYGKARAPNSYLVAAGAWSYSLYLVHHEGGVLYSRLRLPDLGSLATWFGVMACSLAFAYVFYFLVERPSHQLARKVNLASAARGSISSASEVDLAGAVVAPEV
jgi:peptidoglycan/LPS O-acetylase OafA/YrhL